uniref:DDE Tnp4 domain-containing protein n=1 Tax=Oryza nivara TaxID=4536 RepID=A0A0E0HAG5_ORYNI
MSAFLELEPFSTPLFEIPADADFEYLSMLAADDFPLMDGDFLADQPPASAEVVAGGGDASGKRSFHADDGEAMGAVPVSRSSKRRRKAPSSSSSPSHGGGGEGNEPGRWPAGVGAEAEHRVVDRMSDPAACPEADFRRAFRMPRAVFDKLCDDLAAAVAKEDTMLRSAIPVPQRVAVCLWRLATGDPLREWLVGGASYPPTSWMLVPYTHPNLTWAQDRHNVQVADARAAAVGAFRRLRARWQCLRRAEVKLPELANMLAACCVLHNLCERSGEEIDADLLHDDLVDDGVVAGGGNTVRSPAAEQVRDRIAYDLPHQHVGNASLSDYY